MSFVRGMYIVTALIYVIVVFIVLTSLRGEQLPLTLGYSMILGGRFLYMNTRRHEAEMLNNFDQQIFPAVFFLLGVLLSFGEVAIVKEWVR
jgi:hypothetical protein